MSGEGAITPASTPEMCLTLGADTRSGRSDTNQIKALTLAACERCRSSRSWGLRPEFSVSSAPMFLNRPFQRIDFSASISYAANPR